jgi:hypothetical protein
MHFQIGFHMVDDYHQDNVEVKDSTVPRSANHPKVAVGRGLFAKTRFKKGDFVIDMPGYWMQSQLQDSVQANSKDSYSFSIPEDNGWGPMPNLVYATHTCQANFINAGVIDDVVSLHTTRTIYCQIFPLIYSFDHTQPSLQEVARVNVAYKYAPGTKNRNPPYGRQECLVHVVAEADIAVGDELLVNYGPEFWQKQK